MNIQLVAARWSLGYVASEEIPEIAVAALDMGLDSPATRMLAGEDKAIMSEVGPLFERMLAELNVGIPSQVTAVRQIACSYAGEILSGDMKPFAGARKILLLSLDWPAAGIP